jgi:hypothetical protein
MLHAFDRKDWLAVRAAFAHDVDVDYSSLSGVPAARTSADELVSAWQRFADAFDATQHITGPVVVAPRGHGVHARTHVRAYHRRKGAASGEIWMVAGHYEVQLNRVGDGWTIAAMTLHVLYQEGHPNGPAAVR